MTDFHPVQERVPAIPAPEAGLRRGRVRVCVHDAEAEVRTITLGEGDFSWALWAREMRFALENTRFVDVGDTVYRCETIDRIEPIDEDSNPDQVYMALQACLAALTAVRDGTIDDVRGMCQVTLQALEGHGFALREA